MNIRELKYFVAVCDHKSILSASKTLFITQQALSKSIKKLEHELGVLLFNRVKNKLILTSEGEYLYSHALGIIKQYDDFYHEICLHFKKMTKTLHVGAAPGVLRSLDMDVLTDFQASSGVQLEWVEAYDTVCEEQVLSGQLDFALSLRPIDKPELLFFPVKSEPLYWITHRASPLANKEALYFADLNHQPIVLCDKRLNLHKHVKQECAKHGFVPNIVFQVNEIEVILRLVTTNRGGNVCAKHVCNSVAEDKNIVCIPIIDESASWDIGIIAKKENHLTHEITQVINFLKAYFQTEV